MRIVGTITLLIFIVLVNTGCEDIFGKKQDETVEEIFEDGRIDPTLAPQSVGYVPVNPVWDFFSNPKDVFVGYDELVYVADDNGLHVLDQKGDIFKTIDIPNVSEVTQDRRLHTYAIGTANVEVEGKSYELTAVYHMSNTGDGNVQFLDTLIHPFNDASRRNTSLRDEDLEVKFTGIAARYNNDLLIARTGPRNDVGSVSRPDNAVLIVDKNGVDIGHATGLGSNTSSLKSVIGASGLAVPAAPPQRVFGISNSNDFIFCQQGTATESTEFGVLSIAVEFDPEAGIIYSENQNFIDFDKSKADRFLYESFRFKKPADVYLTPDLQHVLVVDAELDSFYEFTNKGYEGVTPPANSGQTRLVNVSFGGTGDGPFEFNEPSGVCYFQEMVYIADKGNNRILRYRLNTNLE